MNTPTEKSAPSVPCRFLRTNRMYVPALAQAALEFRHNHHDQTFYWCNRTLSALGRDDDQVHPCVCQPGRSCHEA
jgi:hypothetical protein